MNTYRLSRAASLSALALVLVSAAQAQIGDWDLCAPLPPPTGGTAPPLHSDDYSAGKIFSQLIGVTIGFSGTTTYGGQYGNCFFPPAGAITANTRGRFCFFNGPRGSVQDTIDDNMALTFGAPDSPGGAWGYANILQGAAGATPASSLFGANGYETFFRGASDTYLLARTLNGNVRVTARFDLVGDAVRIQWDMQNIAATVQNVGLSVGHYMTLHANDGSSRGFPYQDVAGFITSYGPVFVDVPGYRPQVVERRFRRSSDPAGFPSEVNFLLDQSRPYGLRVNTTQSTGTIDLADTTQSLTNADEIVLGNGGTLIGAPRGGDVAAFPDVIFQEPISDVRFNDNPAYIEKYSPIPTAAGGSRRIVQFYNAPWSDSSYGRPYTVVVDKPRVLNLSSTNANAFEQSSYTVRVYVDNNRGFSTVDRELPLEDVNVTLNVGSGLNVVGGTQRTISRIEARRIGFVDFTVVPDATANGDITYTATVQPSPGPTKTVTGTIRATSQPRLPIYNGANLVTSPFVFSNPVWEEILGLEVDTDFQAFRWDPVQAAYVLSTGPDRGQGTWIVSRANRGVITLGSEPKKPGDEFEDVNNPGAGGAPLITLKQGWNLIGNPYPVAIPVAQIVGSTNANASGAFTFNELVQQGSLSGSLAYWDNPNQTYRYIQGSTARLEAQRGYWIFVPIAQDVILRFPPVYQPGYRSVAEASNWVQSDKQWRLQLAARSNSAADDQNFIGLAKTEATVKSTRVYEPPMAPVKGAISVSVDSDIDGQTRSLSQSLVSGGDRQTFRVKVESRDAGPVTLTWPNLSTIPKNVRARMVDKATGETRDLRKFSGYTFTADSRSVRNLEISVEPGFANRVVIGNVVATRDSRLGGNAPFTINYTLATDATTSVRILGSNGREVYAATRGRADKAGSNSVVWNLRDNANRAVAPGSYRVEVVAEGDNGERVRKFYPINLVR